MNQFETIKVTESKGHTWKNRLKQIAWPLQPHTPVLHQCFTTAVKLKYAHNYSLRYSQSQSFSHKAQFR